MNQSENFKKRLAQRKKMLEQKRSLNTSQNNLLMEEEKGSPAEDHYGRPSTSKAGSKPKLRPLVQDISEISIIKDSTNVDTT